MHFVTVSLLLLGLVVVAASGSRKLGLLGQLLGHEKQSEAITNPAARGGDSRLKRAAGAKFYPENLLVQSRPLNAKQKAFLLQEHNDYRKKIPSSNMQYVFWNEQLARTAQRHADRCDFDHSIDRRGVGENIWAAPYADFSDAVRLWFIEVHDPTCKCPHAFKHCCGHYTQVVWAETNQVGCGFAQCSDIWGVRHRGHRYILVCHYYPQGNTIMSKQGRLYPIAAFRWSDKTNGKCSLCPKNKRRCYDGLCY